jgi:hypothetical protein
MPISASVLGLPYPPVSLAAFARVSTGEQAAGAAQPCILACAHKIQHHHVNSHTPHFQHYRLANEEGLKTDIKGCVIPR